jgi:altronate dehydratase small subunit
MPQKLGLLLNGLDNVVNVLEDVCSGDIVQARLGQETRQITAVEAIPFGFKMAASDIARGEPVVKYGQPIGRAYRFIGRGELVHIHNMEGTRGRGDLQSRE